MNQTQIKRTPGKDLAKLVARSYDILHLLNRERATQHYPDNHMSVSEIARALADSPGNVSRIIDSLKDQALVIATYEVRKKGVTGRPKKIISLTYKAQRIVELFKENLKPGLTDLQISILIPLMEDKTLSLETRKVAAGTLCDHAPSISESLLKDQENARALRAMFKQALTNHSRKNGDVKRSKEKEEREKSEEDMKKSTRSILSASLPYIIRNQDTANWFYGKLYDHLLKIAQDKETSKPLRQYAINMLSRAASLSSHTAMISSTIDALLSLYFKDQDCSTAVKDELLNETRLQLQIVGKIKKYAKIEDQKTAAEDLLQVLIKNWWGNDLSRVAASTYQEPVEQ